MIRSDVMISVVEMKMSAERPSSLTAHWLLPDETAEWDAFVARHPLGLVYHLSAWTRVLETAFPHIQGRFLVLKDGADGSIRAGLPVYTVKSWLLGRRVISVPFASFCDPLVSSAAEFDLAALAQAVSGPEVLFEVALPGGPGAEAELFFSDLGYEYVKINAEYTT